MDPKPHPKPKTVMFLDHTASMGGGEVALLHLAQRLDRSRYVPLVVLSSDGSLRHKLEESGVETRVLSLSSRVVSTRKDTLGWRALLQPTAALRTLAYCRRLARFMRARRVDIVHANSLKADVMGGVAARMARVPIIWHVRDRIDDDYLPAPAVRLFRWLCRVLPNYVIANSHATLETLRLPKRRLASAISSGVVGGQNAQGSFAEPPVGTSLASVVHDGVVEHDEVHRSDGKPGSLIGIIGRVTRWKGQHIFLEAAAQVRRDFPDAHFAIIGSALFGEDEYADELRQLVRKLGLEDCVEFTGFLHSTTEYLQKLDVLVHASITSEPFGLVVAEGMVAGKPVIATRGGGVLEIVQDGVSGLLVPMGDPDAMAQALKHLLENPDKARAMGKAARHRVQENFTIELTVQRVQAVYDEIAQRQNTG
jgi:glycosyltransferase involved in cell wall biosynthesis